MHFGILRPLNFSGMAEDRIVKWAWSRSRDVLIFGQISVNISKAVQDGDLQWKTVRKSRSVFGHDNFAARGAGGGSSGRLEGLKLQCRANATFSSYVFFRNRPLLFVYWSNSQHMQQQQYNNRTVVNWSEYEKAR